MAIQIAIIDCGGMANAHLSVCLTIYIIQKISTEVWQKQINERWGVIVV